MTMPMFEIAMGGAVRSMGPEYKKFMGIPEDGPAVPNSLIAFGRQPADEAWVFRCMHLKAMAAASVPMVVEVKEGDDWTPASATSNSAGIDLQFLLDDVNPAWEGAQLRAFTSGGGTIHGGSYWALVKGKYRGVPQEIHWLSGADVTVEMGRTFPAGYWHAPGYGAGERKYYDAGDIVPFRDTINLEDPYTLLSPLSSARYNVSIGKQVAEWNDALLRNWGIPAGAWTADPQAEIGPQDKSFIKRALRALRGPGGRGKTPILPGGLKWQQLSMTQKDADWLSTGKVSRMTVCAVTGVPLVIAGDDEKASVYASMRDAERVFWRQTIINELDHRAVPINSFLVPYFDPDRKTLRVRHDYSGIEALRGAPTEEMAQWLEAVKEGLPFNRYIKQFGMGDPVEGGDEAYKHQKDAEVKAEKEAEKAKVEAEAAAKAPRPEEYDTPGKTGAEPPPGGDRVRALGRGLYRHPTIRAYMENGDTDGMERLVAPEERETFLLGLDRRYSPKQILEGDPARGYPGLVGSSGPLHLSVPITLEDHSVKQLGDGIRELGDGLKNDVDTRLAGIETMVAASTRSADAAVAAVAQVARIVEQVSRPRKVNKIPHRNAKGQIEYVEEVEVT